MVRIQIRAEDQLIHGSNGLEVTYSLCEPKYPGSLLGGVDVFYGYENVSNKIEIKLKQKETHNRILLNSEKEARKRSHVAAWSPAAFRMGRDVSDQVGAWERVTLFGGVKETHSPNSVSCKQQEQGRCKNYSCNFRDRRPPITV
ncbi:hypothetical protein TNCV_2327241 [Trichonephila clavipes]|nr:hypothetical protein TNCV_2327241 [Trichonephila clavipes]